MSNYSNARYDALQIDIRKQTKVGLYFQGNYVWSKVLSDTGGDLSAAWDRRLDMNNGALERARRSINDLNHQVKINAIYELPMGEGHKFNVRGLGRVLGGWSTSGNFTYQSGSPFSVLSGRGQVQPWCAFSEQYGQHGLRVGPVADRVRFPHDQPDGRPAYVRQSALNPADNRAVAPDGTASFDGQLFLQPAAGELGFNARRRMFSAPFRLDAGLLSEQEDRGGRKAVARNQDGLHQHLQPSDLVYQ